MAISLRRITFNALRIGAVAGAVKISIDQGVWDISTDKGLHLYSAIKEKVIPGTIEYPKKMPSCQKVKENVSDTWNSGVKKVFHVAEVAPNETSQLVEKIIKKGKA